MLEGLKGCLENQGFSLSAEVYERLGTYGRVLDEWNQKMDLTNVPKEDWGLLHFADSVLPLLNAGLFPFGSKLVDVGSGAGFPGLPIAVLRPDMKVTLLDSLKKRCLFLETAAAEMGLKNVEVVHARAEDASGANYRERFDLATARAVAPLNVLCEYLLPFVKCGGRAICWKGPALQSELKAGAVAAEILGGRLTETIRLPLEGREHYIQVVAKEKRTPGIYPRQAGTPGKQPLGV